MLSRIKGELSQRISLRASNDRSKERIRRVIMSVFSAGFARGISMATTLLTIPLTAPYLGPERFGLFMTLCSVPLFLSFSDFGIGNGLLTELAKADGRDDLDEARTLVSSAFFLLLAIGAFVALVAIGAYHWIDWGHVFGATSEKGRLEAGPALLVFLLFTALSMPFGVVQRVQQGFQESYTMNVWMAAGNLLSLILLLTFLHLGFGLPFLVGAIAGGPFVSLLINWVVQFSRVRRWLFPRFSYIHMASVRLIFHTGLMIFSSQLGAAILLSCPVFLLAHTAGAKQAASFSVLQRAYSIFVVASSMVMTPLWPAYSEAYERGDFQWVKKTFYRSLVLNALIVAVPLLLMALFSSRLSSIITKGTIEATLPLAFSTALMCFFMATRHCVCMMVNGCGYLRRTAVVFPIGAVLAVSYLVWPWHSAGTYFVPLWISVAEAFILSGILIDAATVLRSHPKSRVVEALAAQTT